MRKIKRALFIFRRDLRLEDNTGLNFALKNAEEVVLGFIFTPEQIEDNPYRSDRCLQFMIESLEDLEKRIRSKGGNLYLFWGATEKIIAECIKDLSIQAVVVNQDYTPYSLSRDQKIQIACEKHNVDFHSFEDLLLHPLTDTLKSDGTPYTIFTPFYRNACKLEIKHPQVTGNSHYYSAPIAFAKDHSIYKKMLPKRFDQQAGGRTAALNILKRMDSHSDTYSVRNFPFGNATTHLSPHLKFTTCSPREIYWAIAKKLGPDSELVRALHWRDFFSAIAFHFPRVFKGAFREKFNKIPWSRNKKVFEHWCEGQTGFPIVDAGMREMNQTGFMHNRVRMIVASFLVKDLHIDWRWGERYFAQKLIDYDPAVNNGNWQWAASTGCDAQPYFRIFNPWSQGLKFDRDCEYIKQWIPELALEDSKTIHTRYLKKESSLNLLYPDPLVDHAKQCKRALELFVDQQDSSS